MFRRATVPDLATIAVEAVLLASEGREFSKAAIDQAVRLAAAYRAPVYVYMTARVHGYAFGLQHPALYPNKEEWKTYHDRAEKAVRALHRRGVASEARVIATRKAGKRIVGEAKRMGADVIVMGADRSLGRVRGDFLWSQEPQRVRRRAARAGIPVVLVGE